MKKPDIYVTAFVTVIAFGLGYIAGRSPNDSSKPEVLSDKTHTVAEAPLPVNSTVVPDADSPPRPQIVNTHQQLSKQEVPVPVDVLHRMLYLAVRSEDCAITADFAKMLGLSDKEREALQDRLSFHRKEIQALERARAQCTTDSSGKLVVSINPFNDEAQSIKDSLQADFKAILGEKKATLFSDLAARDYDRWMSNFGNGWRKVTIETLTSGNGGAPHYAVTDQWTDEANKFGKSPARRVFVEDQFFARYSHLLDRLN